MGIRPTAKWTIHGYYAWTTIFEWCVVNFGCKNEHKMDTCLKESGMHAQKYFRYILTSQLYWGGGRT
jgi:hypothetical protein